MEKDQADGIITDYGNGTFQPLTDKERITANLIVFSDRLPE